MKPILFNTEMVKAILDGRKTVTRRLVKPQPLASESGKVLADKPQYQPGDTLYVPEAWKCRFACLDEDGLGYEVVFRDGKIVRFRFDDRKRVMVWAKYARKNDNHWQSPYFMPRESARIFLRVTGVRVERLQDITEEQAIAEGATGVPCDHPGSFIAGGTVCCVDCMNTGWLEPPTANFATIWNSTIKQVDHAIYGWAANPWVWVIEFERISREEAIA